MIDHLRGYENLHVIGRYGDFKYNNQDHSILMGLLAAENVHAGRDHDLWAVNTDSDYQEAAAASTTAQAFAHHISSRSDRPASAAV